MERTTHAPGVKAILQFSRTDYLFFVVRTIEMTGISTARAIGPSGILNLELYHYVLRIADLKLWGAMPWLQMRYASHMISCSLDMRNVRVFTLVPVDHCMNAENVGFGSQVHQLLNSVLEPAQNSTIQTSIPTKVKSPTSPRCCCEPSDILGTSAI